MWELWLLCLNRHYAMSEAEDVSCESLWINSQSPVKGQILDYIHNVITTKLVFHLVVLDKRDQLYHYTIVSEFATILCMPKTCVQLPWWRGSKQYKGLGSDTSQLLSILLIGGGNGGITGFAPVVLRLERICVDFFFDSLLISLKVEFFPPWYVIWWSLMANRLIIQSRIGRVSNVNDCSDIKLSPVI